MTYQSIDFMPPLLRSLTPEVLDFGLVLLTLQEFPDTVRSVAIHPVQGYLAILQCPLPSLDQVSEAVRDPRSII